MIVGIDVNTLITLIAFPPIFIIMILLALYFLWVPKPAKAYISAKATKKGVDINTSNIGGLTFRTGKMTGPGIFTIKKRSEMTVYPRTAEGWAAKTFNADGVPTLFSCSDKAVSTNPAMLGVLELNQYIAAQKNLPENKGKTEKQILDAYVEKNPDIKPLIDNFKANYANVPQTTGKGKNKTVSLVREVAILSDPRHLKEYVKWNLTPQQILAVDQQAFNDGFEEGQKPILYRILPLILVFGVVAAMIALVLSL